MKKPKKAWSFEFLGVHFLKPLYTQKRWGFMLQNVPGYAWEFGLITPWLVVQRSGKASTRFWVVIALGQYKRDMIGL